jgi:hypothetical protein
VVIKQWNGDGGGVVSAEVTKEEEEGRGRHTLLHEPVNLRGKVVVVAAAA